MATQTVEFRAATGLTITAKLFSAGSDTEVASVSATEATNRKGTYRAAYTDVAAGEYQLIAFDSQPIPVASWWVTLTLTTATFGVYEKADTRDLATSTGVTAAFTEIKGTTWSSATDTLEEISNASGGGNIMVTPVVAQTPVRVVGSNISTFIGDLSTIRIGVFSGSDPVDLTTFGDLEVCVQQKNGTDLDFIEMADLTIDGDDENYISWEPSGPSVADVTRGKWSLRKASNKQVIAYGAWIVEDAALEDVGS
jgi:hypothetical protein